MRNLRLRLTSKDKDIFGAVPISAVVIVDAREESLGADFIFSYSTGNKQNSVEKILRLGRRGNGTTPSNQGLDTEKCVSPRNFQDFRSFLSMSKQYGI